MHLSTVKIPVNFGLDWHCPSVSFLISKPILYQPEKNVICIVFVVYTWVRPPVSSHPPYAACVGWHVSWKIWVVSLKYQYFDTVFRQWKYNWTITICVNAYRKRTVERSWQTCDCDIRFNNRYRTRLQKTLNGLNSTTIPANILTLRLVTSLPSFRQTRHLASPNISTIVHETSKFRYTWRESWCNYVWKTLYLISTLYVPA